MAREIMVTRRIDNTRITAQVFNKDTRKMETLIFSVNGDISGKSPEQIDKIAEKAISNNYRFAFVMGAEPVSGLYGMTLSDFLKHAKPLDESRRFYSDGTEADESGNPLT